MARHARRTHFLQELSPPTEGNLEEPKPPFSIDAGWLQGRDGRGGSAGEGRRKAALATGAVGLLMASVPAAFAVVRRRRRRGFLAAVGF